MSRKKRYYAVRAGRELGIYTDWEECRKQVEGFSGADFKGFMRYDDAEEYLAENIQKREVKTRNAAGNLLV